MFRTALLVIALIHLTSGSLCAGIITFDNHDSLLKTSDALSVNVSLFVEMNKNNESNKPKGMLEGDCSARSIPAGSTNSEDELLGGACVVLSDIRRIPRQRIRTELTCVPYALLKVPIDSPQLHHASIQLGQENSQFGT